MTTFLITLNGIRDSLKELDTWLFLKINTRLTNSVLDSIYPWWRESITWVPLYIFLATLVAINFGKKLWPWLLFAVFTITLADQVSSTFIKHYFERLRPCNDSVLQFKMRLLLQACGSGYSFTSSHATNHFAMAMFFSQTIKSIIGKYHKWLFVWAASVAYGQIYVGVHYPFDVLCGAIFGCLIGYTVALFYNKKIGPLSAIEIQAI